RGSIQWLLSGPQRMEPLATNARKFDDPLSVLRACHERIRRELAALDRLRLPLPENGCDAEARTMALDVLRYFDTAVPTHDADEEQSLFPRLLATEHATALIDRL